MKKIKLMILGLVMCLGLFCLVPSTSAYYICKDGATVSEKSKCTGDQGLDLWDTLKNIINVVLGIVGIISVFMIIIGGISYTTSSGDTGKVKKAKDTILYSVIGLVVALLSFAIVDLVLDNVFRPSQKSLKRVQLLLHLMLHSFFLLCPVRCIRER